MNLSNYLLGLKKGDEIDKDIIISIELTSAILNFQGMGGWAYHNIFNKVYNFHYIRWVENFISFGYIKPNTEFVSTNFSGCRMARYTDNRNRLCGCHIHCIGRNNQGDKRGLWNQNVRNLNARNVVMFYPNANLRESCQQRNPELSYDLWGIITQDNLCYSVIVYSDVYYIYSHYSHEFRAPVYLWSITREPKVSLRQSTIR